MYVPSADTSDAAVSGVILQRSPRRYAKVIVFATTRGQLASVDGCDKEEPSTIQLSKNNEGD